MRLIVLAFSSVLLALAPARAAEPEAARAATGALAELLAQIFDDRPMSDAAPPDTEPDPLAALLATLFEERPARPHTGEVEYLRYFNDAHGVPCRDFVQKVLIGEEIVTAGGTMCRAVDGSWVLRE